MNDKKQDHSMRQEQEGQNSASDAGKTRGAVLPPEARGRIGKQLRQVYDEMLSEPMPEKFTELLARLSKSEPKP